MRSMDSLFWDIAILAGVAGAFMVANLTAGRLIRPNLPQKDKSTAYECGEAPVGQAQVQFDLRIYAVALVYLVLAVEIALLVPWAVWYGKVTAAGTDTAAIWAGLMSLVVFLAVVLCGFAYLWRVGTLGWVRPETTGDPN
jgi:NADH-quinone oxidoreductase subunit A